MLSQMKMFAIVGVKTFKDRGSQCSGFQNTSLAITCRPTTP